MTSQHRLPPLLTLELNNTLSLKEKKQNVKIEIFLSLCFYSTFDLRTCIFSQLKLRPIQ